jgi:hypothetical protein
MRQIQHKAHAVDLTLLSFQGGKVKIMAPGAFTYHEIVATIFSTLTDDECRRLAAILQLAEQKMLEH